MPIYQVQKNGKTFEVDAPSPQAAAQALERMPQAGAQPQPEAPAATGDVVLENYKAIGNAAVDFAKGARAGFATTVHQGGDLIRRSLGMERTIDRPENQAAMTAPDSIAGKAGKFTEQAAELFVPGGAVGKATKLASLPVRMGAQAATAAAVRGVQTGGEPGAMATSAAFAGAAPAVSDAASAVGHKLFEALPEKLYAQIFRHATEDLAKSYRAVANGQTPPASLAKEMLERGVMGTSDDMAIYSLQKLDTLEGQLQAKAGRSVMVMPEKQKYIALLTEIKDRFGAGFFSQQADEAAKLAGELGTYPGPSARATDLLRVKRLLDGLRNTSSFRADPVLGPRQEELKVAADLVRTTLHRNPAMSAILKDEKVFIEAVDSIVADAVRRQNSSVFTLVDAALSSAGPKGAATAAAVRGARTPQVMTGLAQKLFQMGRSAPAAAPAMRGTAAVGAIAAN